MTSQHGQQTITIQILLHISPSIGNKAIKFGQVKQDNKRKIFLQNHAENEAEKLALFGF